VSTEAFSVRLSVREYVWLVCQSVKVRNGVMMTVCDDSLGNVWGAVMCDWECCETWYGMWGLGEVNVIGLKLQLHRLQYTEINMVGPYLLLQHLLNLYLHCYCYICHGYIYVEKHAGLRCSCVVSCKTPEVNYNNTAKNLKEGRGGKKWEIVRAERKLFKEKIQIFYREQRDKASGNRKDNRENVQSAAYLKE
jgi:hypothetical protein